MAAPEDQGKPRVFQVIEIDETSLAALKARAGELYFAQDAGGWRLFGMRIKVVPSATPVLRVS